MYSLLYILLAGHRCIAYSSRDNGNSLLVTSPDQPTDDIIYHCWVSDDKTGDNLIIYS